MRDWLDRNEPFLRLGYRVAVLLALLTVTLSLDRLSIVAAPQPTQQCGCTHQHRQMAEQADFVRWWNRAVSPNRTHGRNNGSVISLDQASEKTGISAMQVSRWRKYLPGERAASVPTDKIRLPLSRP